MERQYYVSVHGVKQRKQAIAWLEEHGYRNAQSLTAENYEFPIFVIEEKMFFGTNTTCMAALTAMGICSISWEEWQVIKNGIH